MGLLNLRNPLRPRDSRNPKLPLYRPVAPPSPTKERYSDAEFSSDDGDDSDFSEYSSSSPPSSRGSRQTSSSMSSRAAMLPKRTFPAARRTGKPYFYRLPNKVIRFMCLGMMTTIILFILSLVRASQLENRRIAEGRVEKQPSLAPAPWESFRFLTRYYGGVRSVVPIAQSDPEYPRAKDEQPYVIPSAAAAATTASADRRGEDLTTVPSTGEIPPSKPFDRYTGSTLPGAKDEIVECFLDEQQTVRVPPVRYMDGRPRGFPDNVLGSYDMFSLPEDICFEEVRSVRTLWFWLRQETWRPGTRRERRQRRCRCCVGEGPSR